MVDEKDHLLVPPDRPSYTLRRVWLPNEIESGYYYGLANEGLWPLCHIAFHPDEVVSALNYIADAFTDSIPYGRAVSHIRAREASWDVVERRSRAASAALAEE